MSRFFLITGATGKLGRQLTYAFLRKGHNVIITSRSSENLSLLTEACKTEFPFAKIMGLQLDLSLPSSLETFYKIISTSAIKIAGIINNAALDNTDTLEAISYGSLERIMKVNYLGPAYLTTLFLRDWCREGYPGSVVNISSLLGSFAANQSSAYSASKAAIESFSRSIAYEYGHVGIRSNILRIACMPGALIKEGEQSTLSSLTTDYINNKNDVDIIPLKRIGKFKDFTEVVLFLISDESSFITGQAINVDGGVSIVYPGYQISV